MLKVIDCIRIANRRAGLTLTAVAALVAFLDSAGARKRNDRQTSTEVSLNDPSHVPLDG
jgi:N-acetylglucosamine kinase-like BadF-type ATPase